MLSCLGAGAALQHAVRSRASLIPRPPVPTWSCPTPARTALRPRSEFFNPSGHATVVIKVGTSSLIREERESLNLSSLAGIVEVGAGAHAGSMDAPCTALQPAVRHYSCGATPAM